MQSELAFEYVAVFGQVSGRMRARLSGVYPQIFHRASALHWYPINRMRAETLFYTIYYANCIGFFVVVADSA